MPLAVSLAYDAAKKAGRLTKAKRAHDDLIAAGHRAQADAAQAKRCLADGYDAAQERGEVATQTDGDRHSKAEHLKPTAADVGLTGKEIHEARIIRDAEEENPGIIRRALDEALRSAGRTVTETRASLRP